MSASTLTMRDAELKTYGGGTRTVIVANNFSDSSLAAISRSRSVKVGYFSRARVLSEDAAQPAVGSMIAPEHSEGDAIVLVAGTKDDGNYGLRAKRRVSEVFLNRTGIQRSRKTTNGRNVRCFQFGDQPSSSSPAASSGTAT
jgi:hypothetical protein